MLHKLVRYFVAVGLSTTLFANDSMDFEPFTGKITGSKVRMRTQPSLEAHVVRETEFGELFAVIGKQDGFYAVSPPENMKGYVFRTFILDGVVEGSHVNVRLYPDIEAPVVAQLNTGDRVKTSVCDVNNKWLEITLPETSRFFVAEEYFDKLGPVSLLAQMKARHHEASHKLTSACLFAQAEIQKPLPQIDLESIQSRLHQVGQDYKDLPEIANQAKEAADLMSEVYVQKKIAFLECKTGASSTAQEMNPAHVERLAKLGIQLKSQSFQIAEAASETIGLISTLNCRELTDKMLVWEPIERSLHHLWAATHPGSIDDFYLEQHQSAVALTGMIESYNRPVKNLPGDYLIRIDNHPAAFLYSTKINLEKLVGRKVTIMGAPRPNNHFAFPAYFVLSVE